MRADGWWLRAEGWWLRAEGWGLRAEGWGLRAQGWWLMADGWGLMADGWGLMAEGWWLMAEGCQTPSKKKPSIYARFFCYKSLFLLTFIFNTLLSFKNISWKNLNLLSQNFIFSPVFKLIIECDFLKSVFVKVSNR